MESKRWHNLKLNNIGMSLVEVLCAVAIFSMVIGTISTIVAVSSRIYRGGVSETSVQQEAQLAANRIGEIIKNANSATIVSVDGGGAVEAKSGSSLSIMTNETHGYLVTHDSLNNNLVYRELTYDGDGNIDTDKSSEQAVLAGNITSFQADVSDFEKNRIVRISFNVQNDGRNYATNYVMTARNEVVEAIDTKVNFVSASCPSELYLEPGQEFEMEIQAVGSVKSVEVSGEAPDGLTVSIEKSTIEDDLYKATINVDKTIADNVTRELHIVVKGEGDASAEETTSIKIRRVNSIDLKYVVDTSATKDNMRGLMEGAGTVFTFYANVNDQNNYKNVNSDGEAFVDYKSTKTVEWSKTASINGTIVDASLYLEEVDKTADKSQLESIKYKLIKDMPSGFSFTVTATSKHQGGDNKSHEMYADSNGDVTKHITGEVTIGARTTKINGDDFVTLEPNESYSFKLNSLGAVSEVVVTLEDSSDGETSANYNPDTDSVDIVVGEDEHGKDLGSSSELSLEHRYNYTFYVKVFLNGDTTPTTVYTVYVSRMDELQVYVQYNFRDKDKKDDKGNVIVKGELMKTPTYDFRARYNVGSEDVAFDSMEQEVKYTYLKRMEKYDDSKGVSDTDNAELLSSISKALSAKISWELKDEKSNKVYTSGSVETMAGVYELDEKGNEQALLKTSCGSYSSPSTYFNIVNIKPARVLKLADGSWTLKQVAEIDISPCTKDTVSGLPAGSVLTITIRALNPDKSNKKYNNTVDGYGEVYGIAVLRGDQDITWGTDYVVAERGQGIDTIDWDGEGADKEFKIPIKVAGNAAYTLEAQVLGNTDSNTRLSRFVDSKGNEVKDDHDENNPYLKNTKGNEWWLGLVIGSSEKGKYEYDPISKTGKVSSNTTEGTGYIMVRVTAKSALGAEISTADIPVAIRAVDKMELKVVTDQKSDTWTTTDSLSSVNKAGSTITLAAYPQGYGDNNGTQFYSIWKQKDNTVCVWEKVTHGEYKTPYAIKWTMTINGTTKELKDWDTYIKTDTIVMDKDEEDNYASTVTFSLVNGVTLPKGAKIRATSLHSLGVDEDGVYYNKSGRNCCVKTYDREAGVYAELEVTSSGSEIRRGQEMIVDDSNLAEAIAFSNALNQYLGVETEAKYYVRYIDKTANTTSIYYRTLEGGSPQKFNAAETLSLLPDRAYRLEFIQVVCDHSKKVVYWPTGLAGVSGTGFEDYTQGSYSGVSGVNDSEIRKFSTISYNIDAVKLTFDKSSSVNNPIELKRNEQSFIKIVSANNLNIADENGGTVLKNDFVANIIQKYDEATKSWVNVGYYDKDSGSYKNYSGNEFKQPWKFTQTDAANIRFQIDGNAESGLYRMGLGLKTSNFTQPSGTVDQIPTYNSVGNLEPYKLYDEAKDSGFVYIKITE